jgi:hypothetical protein
MDWPKHTHFEPLVEMDMSINKKKSISQLESFEKLLFLTVKVMSKMHTLNFNLDRHYVIFRDDTKVSMIIHRKTSMFIYYR